MDALPVEILSWVLTGRSTHGRPLLGIRWRWAAARVCRLWRDIITRAPVGRCQGSRRRARTRCGVQRGRVLCLSACLKWVRNGEKGGLATTHPMAVALVHLALDTSGDRSHEATALANIEAWCANGLGPLDRPLSRCVFCDDRQEGPSCILWRYAIRAQATAYVDRIAWRFGAHHRRQLLDEAAAADNAAIAMRTIDRLDMTECAVCDLWSAVGYYGASTVGHMLLAIEEDTAVVGRVHPTRWRRERIRSSWIVHVARLQHVDMLSCVEAAGQTYDLLEAALAQGRPNLCAALLTTDAFMVHMLGGIVSGLCNRPSWEAPQWVLPGPAISWLVNRGNFEPRSHDECQSLLYMVRDDAALVAKIGARWPHLCVECAT